MTTHLELVEQDNLKMYAAIKRVRELHKPQETMVKPYQVEIICKWCSSDPKYVVYPCPTIKALDGEQ